MVAGVRRAVVTFVGRTHLYRVPPASNHGTSTPARRDVPLRRDITDDYFIDEGGEPLLHELLVLVFLVNDDVAVGFFNDVLDSLLFLYVFGATAKRSRWP